MLSEAVLTQLVLFTAPGASVCGVSNNGFIVCFSSGGLWKVGCLYVR